MPGAKLDYIRMRITSEEKKELIERLNMSGLEVSQYIRMLIELDKREGYICKY